MRNGLRVGRKLRWSSRSIGVATTNTDHTAALAIGHLSRPLRPGEVRQEGNRSTQESARLSHCEWSEEPRQVTRALHRFAATTGQRAPLRCLGTFGLVVLPLAPFPFTS